MANDKIEFESGGVQVIVEARRGGQGFALHHTARTQLMSYFIASHYHLAC